MSPQYNLSSGLQILASLSTLPSSSPIHHPPFPLVNTHHFRSAAICKQYHKYFTKIYIMGNKTQAESGGIHAQACLLPPRREASHRMYSFPSYKDAVTGKQRFQPRNPISDLAPRVLIEGLSHRYPLPSKYPNSRLPEGKQAISITTLFVQAV